MRDILWEFHRDYINLLTRRCRVESSERDSQCENFVIVDFFVVLWIRLLDERSAITLTLLITLTHTSNESSSGNNKHINLWLSRLNSTEKYFSFQISPHLFTIYSRRRTEDLPSSLSFRKAKQRENIILISFARVASASGKFYCTSNQDQNRQVSDVKIFKDQKSIKPDQLVSF